MRSESGLDAHMKSEHEEIELKFQLYAVVKEEFKAMDVRNEIIETLQKQKHVEKVLSVFVDSRN